MKNSPNEWILKEPMFQKIIQAFRRVDVDLFASRMCHQIPWYIIWQPDPYTWTMDAFQTNWTHLKAHTLLPFSRESVSQRNEGQVYVDHNNISVAFQTMIHTVIKNFYTRFNFHFQITHIQNFWQTRTRTNTRCVRIKHLSLQHSRSLATVFCRRFIRPNNWLPWK